MKVEIKPSVLIQSGTLYRIEDLLNYMYSEALKGVNEQEFVSPTHEALRQKTYDSGFLNPY